MTQALETIVAARCAATARLFGGSGNWAIEQPTEQGTVRTEWEYIGEGWCEDYNPSDPDDEQLLRFTILLNGEQVDDASYCTQTPASATDEVQVRLLAAIHVEAIRTIGNGEIKRAMEYMSWISPKDLN